jgi:hypothetical protein
VSVEKGWEEPRLGVKCQANTEIAGSPRNRLRASLLRADPSGYGTVNGRGPDGLLPVRKPGSRRAAQGSQTVGEKLRGREGESPDRPVRSRSVAKCLGRSSRTGDSQEVGLEAAILERVRNSSLVQVGRRREWTGLKSRTEPAAWRAGVR